jgi:hypothetical protein
MAKYRFRITKERQADDADEDVKKLVLVLDEKRKLALPPDLQAGGVLLIARPELVQIEETPSVYSARSFEKLTELTLTAKQPGTTDLVLQPSKETGLVDEGLPNAPGTSRPFGLVHYRITVEERKTEENALEEQKPAGTE